MRGYPFTKMNINRVASLRNRVILALALCFSMFLMINYLSCGSCCGASSLGAFIDWDSHALSFKPKDFPRANGGEQPNVSLSRVHQSSAPRSLHIDLWEQNEPTEGCAIPNLLEKPPRRPKTSLPPAPNRTCRVASFSSLRIDDTHTTATITFTEPKCAALGRYLWLFNDHGEYSRPGETLTEMGQAFGRMKWLERLYSDSSRDNGNVPLYVSKEILFHPDRSTNAKTTISVGNITTPFIIAHCGVRRELHIWHPRNATKRRQVISSIAQGESAGNHTSTTLSNDTASSSSSTSNSLREGHGGIKNIIHLMVDSVSLDVLRRHAPRTLRFLERMNNDDDPENKCARSAKECDSERQAYVYPFTRLHSISCCSVPNQYPMYSSNYNDLGTSMYRAEPRPNSTDWLWNKASEQGFVTISTADICPDYTTRDFMVNPWVDFRAFAPACLPGFILSERETQCTAGMAPHEMPIASLEAFWATHANDRKFAMVQLLSAHESSFTLIKEIDVMLESLFERFVEGRVFNDTALILTSDHGLSFATSHDGVIHKLHPFAFVTLPRHVAMESGFDGPLRANMRQLTTHFDMYELMRSLIYYPQAPPPFARDPTNPVIPRKDLRSLNDDLEPVDLTRERLSPSRDCADASIPLSECFCKAWETVTDKGLREAVLNVSLRDHRYFVSNFTPSRCYIPEIGRVLSLEIQRWSSFVTTRAPQSIANTSSVNANSVAVTTRAASKRERRLQRPAPEDVIKLMYETPYPGKGVFLAMYYAKRDGSIGERIRLDRIDPMTRCRVQGTLRDTERLCQCVGQRNYTEPPKRRCPLHKRLFLRKSESCS